MIIRKKPELAIYAVVFIAIFIMSSLTPLLSDDYTLSYNLATGEKIRSFPELIESISYLRNNINGRVVPHTLAQIILLLPKPVFNVMNAANCVILLALSKKLLKEQNKCVLLMAMSIGIVLVWNFIPAFGNIFLWLDGAINYTWGISFMLAFLYPYAMLYMGMTNAKSTGLKVLHIIVAFLAGAYSENGSVAIIFMTACFLVLLILEKKKIPFNLYIAFVMLILGFAFLMTAPALHANQAAERNFAIIAGNVKTIVSETRSRLLPVYMLYAVLLALNIGKTDKRRICSSLVFVAGGIVSLAAFSVANYFIPRHFCFTTIFLILACVMLMCPEHVAAYKSMYRALAAVLLALAVFNTAVAGLDILGTYANYRERLSIINEAKANGVEGVILQPLLSSSEYSAAMRYDLAIGDKDSWPNPDFAKYHGLEWVDGKIEN